MSPSSSESESQERESVAVPSDFDHSNPWFMQSTGSWDTGFKTEDHQMLRLDDLIEQHAYEEYVALSVSDPFSFLSTVLHLYPSLLHSLSLQSIQSSLQSQQQCQFPLPLLYLENMTSVTESFAHQKNFASSELPHPHHCMY